MTDSPVSEKILDRVARLLAVAEHAGTGKEEADTALRMANSLIAKHAIDEAILRMSQTTEQRRAPEKRVVKLAQGGTGGFVSHLRTILQHIAAGNRCSVALDYTNADLYGASEDVAWVEMLYTSVYFQLLFKINPKWDRSKGYDENVYNFKVAGKKWKEINAEAMRNGHESRESTKVERISRYRAHDNDYEIVDNNDDNDSEFAQVTAKVPNGFFHKMKAAYLRHAKAIGDTDPVSTQSFDVYRLSFVEAFTNTLLYRLSEMRHAADAEADSIPGAALALTSMADDIRVMFYADHPEYDPEVQRERARQAREEHAAFLASMTPKQLFEYQEKQERDRRRANKRIKYYTPDDAATRRGSAVAKEVDLTRKAGSAAAGATRGQLS